LREEGVLREKLTSRFCREEVGVGRGSNRAVPDFRVEVTVKEKMVKGDSFHDRSGGWGGGWGGWLGVVIAGAACIIVHVSAEAVAVFCNECMVGEELEAVAEGPPCSMWKNALDKRQGRGWWWMRVGNGGVMRVRGMRKEVLLPEDIGEEVDGSRGFSDKGGLYVT
jgi:hypothetical protein